MTPPWSVYEFSTSLFVYQRGDARVTSFSWPIARLRDHENLRFSHCCAVSSVAGPNGLSAQPQPPRVVRVVLSNGFLPAPDSEFLVHLLVHSGRKSMCCFRKSILAIQQRMVDPRKDVAKSRNHLVYRPRPGSWSMQRPDLVSLMT